MKFTYILTSKLFFLFLFSPLHAAYRPYHSVFKMFYNFGHDYEDFLLYPGLSFKYTARMPLTVVRRNGTMVTIVDYMPGVTSDHLVYLQNEVTFRITLAASDPYILFPTTVSDDINVDSIKHKFEFGNKYFLGDFSINTFAYNVLVSQAITSSAFYGILTVNQTALNLISPTSQPKIKSEPDNLRDRITTTQETVETEPEDQSSPSEQNGLTTTEVVKSSITLPDDTKTTYLNKEENAMGCLKSPNEAVHCEGKD